MTLHKMSILVLTGVFALSLSACNTIRGVGKDTEKVGEKIQEEADRNSDDDGSTRSNSR